MAKKFVSAYITNLKNTLANYFWLFLLCCLAFISGCGTQSKMPLGGDAAYTSNTPAEPPHFQEGKLQTEFIGDNSVKTIQFFKAGLLNSYPVIEINTNDRLILQFDILGSRSRNLQFTIVHCDADWRTSNLLPSDYITGLSQDFILNFSYSTNTYQRYIHYRTEFPNNNIAPKISGNYALVVYEDDVNRPLFVRRFYVVEHMMTVMADVHRAVYAKYRDTHHEIDFTINTNNVQPLDPYRDLKVVLRQNWRSDNEITDLKPTYMNDQSLVYNYEEGNLFEAGNEFRPFDTRDVRFKGMGIRYFTLDSMYSATLMTDEDKSYKTYIFYTDQNGMYTITSRQGIDAATDADYMWVNFRLKPTYSEELKTYVFGALTNWKIDERFRMNYSVRDGYTCTALLKQGYYDYQYVTVDENGKVSPAAFEGNHWETENNYTIFIYYRPRNQSGDRLVGYRTLNTTAPGR